ncbi:MAG: hypothetical protein A2076_07425 [Geobacteraceae bacterium GWC2_53_11]|nr:MAG: hypothetical protein A2076_07425 [Geobacteraceae bacterium GWC2_53_11]
MLEKNFENVLHRYPELIEDGLKFSGRQVSVGGKFVDLLFVDRFGQKLIIELKKGVIKREHIAQLLDYEGHFLTTDNPNIRVMLIGNRVPMNLRNALDHHGFEWKEITVSQLISFLIDKNDTELLEEFKDEQTTPIETKTLDKSVTSTSKIRDDVNRANNKGHNWNHNAGSAVFTNRGTGGTVPLKAYGRTGTFQLAVAEKLATTGFTEAEFVQFAHKMGKMKFIYLKKYINFFTNEGFDIICENGRYIQKGVY